jgi:hypothetical protein
MKIGRPIYIVNDDDLSTITDMSDELIDGSMIYDMQVFVRRHGAALIPLLSPDDMHVPHTERVRRSHDRTHVEITLQILNRDLKFNASFIQTRDYRFFGHSFEFVYHIA